MKILNTSTEEINQATYKYSGFKMASDVKNQYWNLEDNAGTL